MHQIDQTEGNASLSLGADVSSSESECGNRKVAGLPCSQLTVDASSEESEPDGLRRIQGLISPAIGSKTSALHHRAHDGYETEAT